MALPFRFSLCWTTGFMLLHFRWVIFEQVAPKAEVFTVKFMQVKKDILCLYKYFWTQLARHFHSMNLFMLIHVLLTAENFTTNTASVGSDQRWLAGLWSLNFLFIWNWFISLRFICRLSWVFVIVCLVFSTFYWDHILSIIFSGVKVLWFNTYKIYSNDKIKFIGSSWNNHMLYM